MCTVFMVHSFFMYLGYSMGIIQVVCSIALQLLFICDSNCCFVSLNAVLHMVKYHLTFISVSHTASSNVPGLVNILVKVDISVWNVLFL